MPIISISVLSGPGIFTSGSWGFGVVRLLGAGDVHLELAKIAPTPEKINESYDIGQSSIKMFHFLGLLYQHLFVRPPEPKGQFYYNVNSKSEFLIVNLKEFHGHLTRLALRLDSTVF